MPATKTAARLLEEGGDKAGAIDAYNALATNPDVPPDIQLSTNLLVARMLLKEKQYQKAETKLKTVLDATKDDKQRSLLTVYLAQTKLAQGNVQDIETKMNEVLKGAADAGVKAAALNTLGDYYQQAKQPDEAFWRYLRVDVLYNQDREEHARALYNLSKLFESVRADAAALEGLSGAVEGQVARGDRVPGPGDQGGGRREQGAIKRPPPAGDFCAGHGLAVVVGPSL